MQQIVEAFARDESGQDLIEYALILGLMGLASIVALGRLSSSIADVFSAVSSRLNSAT